MRYALPLLLLLPACAPPPPDVDGLQKELAELRKELDELVTVRAEMCGALDELGTQLRRLREKTPPPPPTFPALLPRTSSSTTEFYWVLSPMNVKGEARTALALYRAKDGGFALENVRIVEEDVANALK